MTMPRTTLPRTTLPRTVAALTLATAVALGSGCSADNEGATPPATPANSADDGADGGPQALPDACSLLTLEETSAYAGLTFTRAEQGEPDANTASCTWENDADLGFVQIVVQRGIVPLADTRAVMEGAQDVDGLGEDAFIDATDTVWFSVGDWIISVGDYQIDGDIVGLAKLAFDRL